MKKQVIIFLVVFFIVGVGVTYFLQNSENDLPIYNPADLNPKLVDRSLQNLQSNHKVGKFSLIDQDGEAVSEFFVKDKIYVVDFFFVTCPTICPKMTDQMYRVYKSFEEDNGVVFLSHTVMPEHDSVAVLKEYGEKYGIQSSRWKLLTGDKKHIYELARKHYFAAVTEGDGSADDFVHTENFVLVDRQRRLRGFYDGTSMKDVDRLIVDIEKLNETYDKDS